MRANPMTFLAVMVIGGCLLTGISCKQTSKTPTASVVPPGDPLLPSTISPPITPIKTTSNTPTDASATHK